MYDLAESCSRLCGELLIVSHTFVFRVSESSARANDQSIDYFNSALWRKAYVQSAHALQKNGVKTWKKLVATENDMEFEYSDNLEWPALAVKACFCHFQPFYRRTGPRSTRTGCRSTRTAAKNLEERDRT